MEGHMTRFAQWGMAAGLILFLYGLCDIGYGVWTLNWPLLSGQFSLRGEPRCYAVGAEVQIAYAQNKPKTAYLEPGPTIEGVVALGLGAILGLFGASLNGFARRRAGEDISASVRQEPHL